MDGGEAAALAKLRSYLYEEVGYDVDRYRQDVFLRRVKQRMRALQVSRLDSYLEHLQSEREERRRLLEQLHIGATSFFRDPEVFEALVPFVRRLIDEGPRRELRVWVPGCATGEEAYSLAMVLVEALEAAERPWELRLFATDLDEAAIQTARRGRYPLEVADEIAPERLRRFLLRRVDCYEIAPELRGCLRFARHDLLVDPPFSRIDFLSCRNLLMYLEPGIQRGLRQVLHRALLPGGYLFLGLAESAGESPELFEAVHTKACLFRARERPPGPPPPFPLARAPRSAARRRTGAPAIRHHAAIGGFQARHALRKLGITAIAVDARGEIVDVSGQPGRYLSFGSVPVGRDLLRLVARDLRAPLRELMERSREERGDAVTARPVQIDGASRRVEIRVHPLPRREGRPPLWQVILRERGDNR